MIAETFEAAFTGGMLGNINIFTDDPEIADVALKHCASTTVVRECFAHDHSPMNLAGLGFAPKLSYRTLKAMLLLNNT